MSEVEYVLQKFLYYTYVYKVSKGVLPVVVVNVLFFSFLFLTDALLVYCVVMS